VRLAATLFAFILRYGGPGLLVLGILDSSFLFVIQCRKKFLDSDRAFKEDEQVNIPCPGELGNAMLERSDR
jgi:hypothetical protein